MRIWFDTEFIEDGKTIELLSIGMVREDGATYYAEPSETDRGRADEWVQRNVLPHLRGALASRKTIAKNIIDFAGPSPVFWAYYADYDWVVLCQLYGRMIDLPTGWPMFCRDLQQVIVERGISKQDLPEMTGTAHNALDDALWTKAAHEHITRIRT